MAVGTLRGSTLINTANPVQCGSVQCGLWTTAHDNLTATAASAAVLKKPLSNSSSNTHFVRVPPGATRVMIRAKHQGTSAVVTSPIVSIYGVYGEPLSDGTFSDSTVAATGYSAHDARIIASAVTLTCATGDLQVGTSPAVTYQFGVSPTNAIDSNPWFDVCGASHVLVLVSTAGSLTDATEVVAQVQFLN